MGARPVGRVPTRSMAGDVVTPIEETQRALDDLVHHCRPTIHWSDVISSTSCYRCAVRKVSSYCRGRRFLVDFFPANIGETIRIPRGAAHWFPLPSHRRGSRFRCGGGVGDGSQTGGATVAQVALGWLLGRGLEWADETGWDAEFEAGI
jgi:hypothetical protein